MSENLPDTPAPLPGWARGLASVVIAGHLAAVVGMVLAAPSGPWPSAGGTDWATPPQFAQVVSEVAAPYLSLVKMTHNYHFTENRPEMGCRFDVRLLDESGKELKTLQFPEESAGLAVRHRQLMLAHGLNDDEQQEPLPGEAIPAPGQPIKAVRIWEMGEGRVARIGTVEEHLIPRDREVFAPTDWAMLLARSYARHLCRSHGAASVEIVRVTKDNIPPDVMFLDSVPPGAFDEMTANFGVLHAPSKVQ